MLLKNSRVLGFGFCKVKFFWCLEFLGFRVFRVVVSWDCKVWSF